MTVTHKKNVVVGVAKDLADLNKARYVERLIHEECAYYRLDQEAQLQVRYSIASVKFEALKFKLAQIQIAKQQLKKILLAIKKRIDSHNDTLRTYYEIESSLMKLDDAEREIEVDLAGQQAPKMRPRKLGNLLKELSLARERRQKTMNQLEKQNNWSMRFEAGAQQDFSNHYNKSAQPYIAVLLRYNLGSAFSDKLMNQALGEQTLWQENQLTGTQNQLSKLMLSLASLKAATEDRLSGLRQNYQNYARLSRKLTISKSTKAIHFRQEVEVNKMMLAIEINHAKRMIELLQATLK